MIIFVMISVNCHNGKPSAGTLHEIALVEKYVEKTTINSWFFFAFNLQNRKPNFAQKSLYKLCLQLNDRKVCGKTWRKKFVKNSKWKSLCGYFVSSLCRKTLWLLYVYVRDFCDGITFLGKVHFCIRKRLLFFHFKAKFSKFLKN